MLYNNKIGRYGQRVKLIGVYIKKTHCSLNVMKTYIKSHSHFVNINSTTSAGSSKIMRGAWAPSIEFRKGVPAKARPEGRDVYTCYTVERGWGGVGGGVPRGQVITVDVTGLLRVEGNRYSRNRLSRMDLGGVL